MKAVEVKTTSRSVWDRIGVEPPFMVRLFGGLPLWRVARGATALVLVDMQRYCAVPGAGIWSLAHERDLGAEMSYYYEKLEIATQNLKRLLEAARREGIVVIHVNRDIAVATEMRKRSADRGSSDSGLDRGLHQRTFDDDPEPVEALRPLPGEIIVKKKGAGPFGITSIDHVLRQLGIELVVVGGVATHQCVEQTVRGAFDFGYKVILAEDGTATVSADLQRNSLIALADWFCKSMTTEEILTLVARSEIVA